MHENEVDVCTKPKTKWIGRKLFDFNIHPDFYQNITQMSLYISCWLIDLAHKFLDMEPPNMSTNKCNGKNQENRKFENIDASVEEVYLGCFWMLRHLPSISSISEQSISIG